MAVTSERPIAFAGDRPPGHALPRARSRRRGDVRACARALRRRPQADGQRPAPAPPARRAAQPDHHRRAQVRDHEHPPLPRPPSRDPHVEAEGAQLLRPRAELGPRASPGTAAASTPAAKVRGESSPHYTNQPRYTGVAERIRDNVPDAKLLYMVRDPISRILSHWRHATGAGYETRPMEEVLSRDDQTYVTRSLYWMQLQPYLELFAREQIEVITQEELQSDREGTMRARLPLRRRRRGLHLRAVRPRVGEVDREGVRPVPAHGEADQAARLPLLRPQLRPPARALRWMVEKVVHDPDAPEAPKPELSPEIESHLLGLFGEDVRGAAAVRRPRVRRLEDVSA